MTLNNTKREKINFEKKTKSGFYCNSFDRFGDDLCELLLSNLLIIDKIRLDCVSKQWQFFIFNKQRKLIINGSKTKDSVSVKNKIWKKNSNLITEFSLRVKNKFLN